MTILAIAVLLAILAFPLLTLAYTTRRRPLVVRETPVISHLPHDIDVPTIKRRSR